MHEPIANHCFSLEVGDLHQLYVEDYGKSDGVAVVVLHGGPGAGMSRKQVETFDLSVFRVILFDQRGAGRSTPHADLTDNTTDDLISDIETIRQALGIEVWLVAGGSWEVASRWPTARLIRTAALACVFTAFFSPGRMTSTGGFMACEPSSQTSGKNSQVSFPKPNAATFCVPIIVD